MPEKVIIFVLLFSFSIQIFFYLFFYIRVFFISNNTDANNIEKPVSVIISAKNEFKNLKDFLPKVLNQNYPVFQVIVVNDASVDQSSSLLHEFSLKYKHLKVIEIDVESEKQGKKYALTKAIEASKYDYLLFTDADCYPTSENWIKLMMSAFTKKTDIVLAYGAYEQSKGFLNKLIRFDTLFIALKYLSFAKAGLPYMGVGRNLAYRKSCFINNQGFESHIHIKSGDDDLFVNKIANKENTSVSFNFEGITKSIPEKTFKKILKQKRRHLTTGLKYRLIHEVLLGAESFSIVLFYFTIIIALFSDISLVIIGLFYFIKISIQIIIISFFADIVKEKKNLIFIPIFDVLIPAINLYAVISNVFLKNREWK